jgi:hypothetical protein
MRARTQVETMSDTIRLAVVEGLTISGRRA